MKIHFCLLFILIWFTVSVSGQTKMPIRTQIDTKALFQKVAEKVSNESDPNSIKYYSIKIDEIVSQSSKPEEAAAVFLLELQGSNPGKTIDNMKHRRFKPTGPGQTGLNLYEFIIAYLKTLTLYYSRDESDPIALPLNDLSTSEVRLAARKFRKNWRGDIEDIAELVIETKKEVERIGIGNLDTPGLRLFFPLCLITKGGC